MVKYYKKFNWKLFSKNKIKFLKKDDFIGKKCMILKNNIRDLSKVKFKILTY